jgi:MFS family permease
MDEQEPESHDPYAALRLPGYRRFILSLGLATLGLQMQGVVVGWQVYARTGDPLALGLVGLAEALPFLMLALFGGHAADRLNRLRIVRLGTLSLAACSAICGPSAGIRAPAPWPPRWCPSTG